MIKLDDNLLVELGLRGLPKEEKTAFLKHMYETLEMRVGTKLAEKMSDAQMTEFEQFINSNDEQGAFHWLESNFPNYKDVVAAEFETLKTEVKPLAEQILASSTAHAQQAQHVPPAPQQLPPANHAAPAPGLQPADQPPFDPSANAFAPMPPSQPPAAAPAPYAQPPAAQPPQPSYGPQPMPQQPLHQTPPAQPPASSPAGPSPQYPQPVQPPPYTPPQN